MASTVTSHVDASNITGILRELSRITGKDFETIVRSETVEIMHSAIEKTDAAQMDLINQTKSPTLKAQKIAARGLQKKVWAQVGEAMGLQITKIPQYAQAATTPKGDFPEDAQGGPRNQGSSFTMDGQIFRVYWPGIRSALARAINGRKGFFYRNLRKGVFDKAEEIAKKYKGLHLTRDV